MNKQAALQRRKAELKAQIEQQQHDLRHTLLELRTELEPANLLKKALLGASNGQTGAQPALPAPLAFIADALGKDSKWGVLIKLLAPLVMRWVIRREKKDSTIATVETPPEKSGKAKLYGRLRGQVSVLLKRLHSSEDTPNT
jgi:hypothetical protein